ncbi:MAG: L,D-transpeptidase family protein [Nocardioides sp.]
MAGSRLRRTLVGTTATLAVLATAAGAAYGVLGLSRATDGALRHRDATPVAAGPAPSTPATGTPGPSDPAPSLTPAPTPAPAGPTGQARPAPVLSPGDSGTRVRELQARLSQLAWFGPVATGAYDPTTRAAVRGFQGKRGLERTGIVDPRTWHRLVAMTRTPTHAELFDKPGPTLLGPGDAGRDVRRLQARLRQVAWFFGDVTDHYGADTATAVRGFQGKRGIPVTGEVDRRTLDLLVAMTHDPTADELANRRPDPADGAALDPRCTTGRALCIDKTSSSLRWVVDGKVLTSLDVRFGASYSPTREGLFHVLWKDRDHVSNLYGSSMPFAMFFSGGQAVHYSSDFAARGYAGASHGCVNVRDYDALAHLFDQVRVGDKVVVYWS